MICSSILQKIENIKIVTFKCHKNVHYIEVTRGAESSLIPPNYPDGQFLADIVHTKCQLLPMCPDSRVAGLGRLSAGAKMAMKPSVKRVFTILATNASFLRVI